MMNSSLSENNREYMINLLSQANDNQLCELVALLEDNPDFLENLVDIYRAKEESIVKNDKILWQRLVNKEIELLKELEK